MSEQRRWILAAGLGAFILGWLATSIGPRVVGRAFPSTASVSIAWQDELRTLADSAGSGGDVPVAALVIYGDSIIGRGRNTEVSEGDAGGHAEIKALTDAIRRIGSKTFRSLDRDSLVLLSTYEPCLMCEGAMLEHNVRRAWYLLAKPYGYWVREDLRLTRILWSERQKAPADLQKVLFEKYRRE